MTTLKGILGQLFIGVVVIVAFVWYVGENHISGSQGFSEWGESRQDQPQVNQQTLLADMRKRGEDPEQRDLFEGKPGF